GGVGGWMRVMLGGVARRGQECPRSVFLLGRGRGAGGGGESGADFRQAGVSRTPAAGKEGGMADCRPSASKLAHAVGRVSAMGAFICAGGVARRGQECPRSVFLLPLGGGRAQGGRSTWFPSANAIN